MNGMAPKQGGLSEGLEQGPAGFFRIIGTHDRAHDGDALCAGCANRGNRFNIDATDRKPGHGRVTTGFRHPAQAGRAEIALGLGGEDGANAQIIGARLLGLEQVLEAVGAASEQAFWAEQLSRF